MNKEVIDHRLNEIESKLHKLSCNVDYINLYLSTPSREDWEQEHLLRTMQEDIESLKAFQYEAEDALRAIEFFKRNKKLLLVLCFLVMLPLIDLFTHADLTGIIAHEANIPQIDSH